MRHDTRTLGRSAGVALATAVAIIALSGCLPGASHDPKSGPGDEGPSVSLLHATRLAANSGEGGFDRFVLEFENHVPAWQVGYVAKPVQAAGTGHPVPLAGNHAIEVRMFGASGVDFSASGDYRITYTGPERIATGTPQVTEVVQTGDFEATLTWAIGTREHQPFRVLTLADPARLVVDVAHG
jgi:hypothetical protein